jgi:hypothetical protein
MKSLLASILFLTTAIGATMLITTQPAKAQAATSVKCGDKSVVTVDSGDAGGECTISKSIVCKNGVGSVTARGGCVDGTATCGDTSGSGSCTITRSAGVPKGVRPGGPTVKQ